MSKRSTGGEAEGASSGREALGTSSSDWPEDDLEPGLQTGFDRVDVLRVRGCWPLLWQTPSIFMAKLKHFAHSDLDSLSLSLSLSLN
jgi:hypothetical protein